MEPQMNSPQKFTSKKYIEMINNGKKERYYMDYLNSGNQANCI